ncbi:MAG: flagella basal body P-ring formation protein FlgA [Halieaceae bacterium]|jgi:flagella basal body P-ring formation protein FlgA
MTIFWRTACSIGVLLSAMASVASTDQQPIASITAAAAAAGIKSAQQQGYKDVTAETRPLDRRLNLALCSEPLSIIPSRASRVLGPVSIGVRCAAPKPWTIYVRANVFAQQVLPVLVDALPRHSIIATNDLMMVSQALLQTDDDLVLKLDQIVGMELTQAVKAGSPLRFNQLRQPRLINRGQQVIIVSKHKGLEVSAKGTALADATAGERVVVSNTSSGRKIEGVVNTDGTVSVP